MTEHWGYLVDFNLERYFDSKEFSLNKNNSSKLNSRRATHKIKFAEKVKKYIKKYNLIEIVEKYWNENISKSQLEAIDKKIICILNKA